MISSFSTRAKLSLKLTSPSRRDLTSPPFRAIPHSHFSWKKKSRKAFLSVAMVLGSISADIMPERYSHVHKVDSGSNLGYTDNNRRTENFLPHQLIQIEIEVVGTVRTFSISTLWKV